MKFFLLNSSINLEYEENISKNFLNKESVYAFLQKSKGFTLIELMIVVAIIGILAAVAIPQYSSFISRSRAAAAIAELGSTKKAISICYEEHMTFTGCSAGFLGVPTITTTKNIIAVGSIVNGVIIVTTAATSAGANLIINDTPSFVHGDANILWTNSGSICHADRGLKPGTGDCP